MHPGYSIFNFSWFIFNGDIQISKPDRMNGTCGRDYHCSMAEWKKTNGGLGLEEKKKLCQ